MGYGGGLVFDKNIHSGPTATLDFIPLPKVLKRFFLEKDYFYLILIFPMITRAMQEIQCFLYIMVACYLSDYTQ